jgi:hypothetical protein
MNSKPQSRKVRKQESAILFATRGAFITNRPELARKAGFDRGLVLPWGSIAEGAWIEGMSQFGSYRLHAISRIRSHLLRLDSSLSFIFQTLSTTTHPGRRNRHP